MTDSEVLHELLHRYFSIHGPDIAQVVYHATVRLCEEVLAVTERPAAGALDLLLQAPGISARDAIHVSVMKQSGIVRILSTDRHFDAVPDIRRVDSSRFLAGSVPAS